MSPLFVLHDIAEEMKANAAQRPITLGQLLEGIAAKQFPESLKQRVEIEGYGIVQIQFSFDDFLPGKLMHHLSFSRDDKETPDDNMKKAFQEAFFGDDANILLLPSTLGSHIVHIAKIVTSQLPQGNWGL